MKVSLIQMSSSSEKQDNIAQAETLVAEVAKDRPDFIVLPEYWAMLDDGLEAFHASAESFPDGSAYRAMRDMARRHNVTLHGGSIVEASDGTYYNTTAVFGPKGEERARYRKIHLFDVDVPGGTRHRESEQVSAGDQVVTYELSGTVIGCAICYDIRFPELFRALRDKGADVIVLPAAFTLMTGKDHWEVLVRARAIETGTYFLAVDQFGTCGGGKKAYHGHSMLIDPWGHIVAQVSDHIGHVTARIDPPYKEKIRAAIPVHHHHVL